MYPSLETDTDYRVKLDIFEGPLDLLLYLTKKDEVDIYGISIERITKQYLEFINAFKILNIDLASEFIVMAANLMYIKSRSLLPRHLQPPEEETEEDDPRWELIRQLIECKKFKDAAGLLGQRASQAERYFDNLPEKPASEAAAEEPLSEVSIFDLIRAFQVVLKRFQDEQALSEIVEDRFTVTDKIEHLLQAVAAGRSVRFSSLFQSASTRSEVIVTFLALLELIRLKEFRIRQDSSLGKTMFIGG